MAPWLVRVRLDEVSQAKGLIHHPTNLMGRLLFRLEGLKALPALATQLNGAFLYIVRQQSLLLEKGCAVMAWQSRL